MKRLLHIIATPRGSESRTLEVASSFLESFLANHSGWVIDELDLFKEDLPPLSVKSVSGKYVLLSGQDLYGSLKETWGEIVQHIERFKTADFFLISTPMWNFSIPYILKQYLDLIVQPHYLFSYLPNGKIEGVIKNKKMVVITSRGGQYGGYLEKMDFEEPYLRTIFGFIGITDISFIKAEGMDTKKVLEREERLNKAKKLAFEAGIHA